MTTFELSELARSVTAATRRYDRMLEYYKGDSGKDALLHEAREDLGTMQHDLGEAMKAALWLRDVLGLEDARRIWHKAEELMRG